MRFLQNGDTIRLSAKGENTMEEQQEYNRRGNQLVRFKHVKGKLDICRGTVHDYCEIYLLLDGHVEYVNRRIRRQIMPGQLVLVPGGEYHQFVVKEPSAVYERCILDVYPWLFDDDTLAEAIRDKEVLTLPADHRILGNFQYLKDGLQTYDREDYSHVLSAVATDIILLIKQMTDLPDASVREQDPLALQIMEYINENFGRQLSLSDIANRFYISVSTVCHCFRASFGISVKKYLSEKRMVEARQRLRRGEKAQEVCTALGYPNYSTFYRAYKTHFGTAPSEKITL